MESALRVVLCAAAVVALVGPEAVRCGLNKTNDEFYGGPEGFVGSSVVAFAAVVVAYIAGFVIYCVLRDALRFGRQRLPFPWMLFFSAILSAAGFAIARWLGLLTASLLLALYGFGRWQAKKAACALP